MSGGSTDGFGLMATMWDAWGMDGSTDRTIFPPSLRCFPGCGTFSANIETVGSKLGIWSP